MTEIEIKGEIYRIYPIENNVTKVERIGQRIMYHYGNGNASASGRISEDWELVLHYSTATESDFEKVVGIEFDGDFQDFASMNNNCITAKGSFQTLLQHHSLDPNADYIILKRK